MSSVRYWFVQLKICHCSTGTFYATSDKECCISKLTAASQEAVAKMLDSDSDEEDARKKGCFFFVGFLRSFIHVRARSGDGCGSSSVMTRNTSRFSAFAYRVLLAPHQDGTKPGWRCNHATWSLDDIRAAFPWA